MGKILKLFVGTIFFVLIYCKIDFWHDFKAHELAVIINPIADVSLKSLEVLFPGENTEEVYKNLPYAPEDGQIKYSCPRFHQLLFNEVVKIKRELNNEVECEVFNMFYDEGKNPHQKTVFLLKKNLLKFNDLIAANVDIYKIPFPFNGNMPKSLNNILTLKKPWIDTKTQITYSIGTRFLRNSSKDTSTHYAVFVLDPVALKINHSFVKKELAIVLYPTNKEIAVKMYLEHLLQLSRLNNCFIPYVWGGCSYTCDCNNNNFTLVNGNKNNKEISYWARPEKMYPNSGLDCSGLILRTAQIYGLPYFYKNTATILNNMKPLRDFKQLKEGDLLCYPGHVFIVSGIKDNKLIEAVGYKSGFGKLHELPLNRIFKDINTFEDLDLLLKSGKPLERIDISGQIIRSLPNFYFFPILSIWD